LNVAEKLPSHEYLPNIFLELTNALLQSIGRNVARNSKP